VFQADGLQFRLQVNDRFLASFDVFHERVQFANDLLLLSRAFFRQSVLFQRCHDGRDNCRGERTSQLCTSGKRLMEADAWPSAFEKLGDG
jgi:hypothetical protein